MSESPERTAATEYRAVVRAARGDREAFTFLVDRYDRKLLYFVRRLERDSHLAEEIVQDVWLTAFRRLPGLRVAEAFRVWIYRLAHDRAVTRVRRGIRNRSQPIEMEPQCRESCDSTRLESAELVHRALELVSPEHRAVLTLRFLEEMSLEEIAGVVDRPLGTVKSRMYYAKLAFEAVVREMSDGNPLS